MDEQSREWRERIARLRSRRFSSLVEEGELAARLRSLAARVEKRLAELDRLVINARELTTDASLLMGEIDALLARIGGAEPESAAHPAQLSIETLREESRLSGEKAAAATDSAVKRELAERASDLASLAALIEEHEVASRKAAR